MTGRAAPVPASTRAQGLRYLLVGGVNFAFGLAVFVALQVALGEAIGYAAVFCIAWVINVTESYALNRMFVFRVRGAIVRDYLRFCLVQLVGAALNLGGLVIAVDGFGLSVLVAQTFLFPTVVVVTFLGHKLFSFRRSRHETQTASR